MNKSNSELIGDFPIKFSHEYNKFPRFDSTGLPCNLALLRQVFIVDKKELSESFISYDTTYIMDSNVENSESITSGHYPLPEGKLIVLFLEGILDTNTKEVREMFTTVRRWTPQKEVFYRSKMGKLADIIITEESV